MCWLCSHFPQNSLTGIEITLDKRGTDTGRIVGTTAPQRRLFGYHLNGHSSDKVSGCGYTNQSLQKFVCFFCSHK